MNAAEEAVDALAQTGTPIPPPECEEAGRNIREALYDNKHSRGGEGGHGYLRRMLEQICGAFEPGTTGWDNHISPLVGERNNFRAAQRKLNEEGCDVVEFISRRDRQLMDLIENQNGWQPEGIQWIGRDDSRCNGWDAIARGEDNGALIRKLLALAGGSL